MLRKVFELLGFSPHQGPDQYYKPSGTIPGNGFERKLQPPAVPHGFLPRLLEHPHYPAVKLKGLFTFSVTFGCY